MAIFGALGPLIFGVNSGDFGSGLWGFGAVDFGLNSRDFGAILG